LIERTTMSAHLIDGTAVAARFLEQVTVGTTQFARAHGRIPCLATVLVGDHPTSRTYVRMKRNRTATVGMESRYVELPASTTTGELVAEITTLSDDPVVDGILLQHPVPDHVDERAAFEAIAPIKDVDGVTMQSFAAMAFDAPGFHSCTPGGILRLLDAYDVALSGTQAVMIGRSPILGRPVGMLLLARDATVRYCHSRTLDLADHVRRADIVVAAVGRAELIRGEWIKPGAVVVDADITPVTSATSSTRQQPRELV
jgi:methylenetetrahydrofolate dehydrogenase (NADP+) / methenyltetrahydrofolate cyclohydrolase